MLRRGDEAKEGEFGHATVIVASLFVLEISLIFPQDAASAT